VRTPILKGRVFTVRDTASTAPVVVVNQLSLIATGPAKIQSASTLPIPEI